MSDEKNTPADLETLLEERGVTAVEAFVSTLGDDFNLDACVAAVSRYDREGQDAPGLLVYRVREAAKSRYKPHGAERYEPVLVPQDATAKLLASIRRTCGSPDGFTRQEARDTLAGKARVMGVLPDALIDAAMGEEWKWTAPHPALDKRRPAAERAGLYERWVAGSEDAA